jgi:hypothetical protein
MSTSGSVMLAAATHLNDANQLVYTPLVLLPLLNMAIDELQEELGVHEIEDMKKESIIILVPSDSSTIPQLPLDFLETINILERSQGSQDAWTTVDPVRAIDPNLKTSNIMQWSERSDRVLINPPTSGREILLEYVASMTIVEGEDGPINIETSRRLLALLTARNAARDLGNSASKANTYEPDIGRARDRLVRRLQKKSMGTLGVRRRPYTGRQ